MSLGITRLKKIAYRAFCGFTIKKKIKIYIYIIIAGGSLPIYSLYRYFIIILFIISVARAIARN